MLTQIKYKLTLFAYRLVVACSTCTCVPYHWLFFSFSLQ